MGDFALQRNVRYSAGLDQALSPLVRVNVLYNWVHFQQQPRGDNLNPLIGGVRPDPNFTIVIAVVTDSETRRHEITSPFYRQATFAQTPRRVDVGMNLTF
jgi:hypothetical protein